MKRTCIYLVFCGLFFCGCMEKQKTGSQAINSADANKVKSEFPKFLVGVWESDTYRWAFKFESDGKISKLVHTVGIPINVNEGMYYSENPDANGTGLFVLGPCDANYNPDTKVLKVSIILDYFRIELSDKSIEGLSKDLFEGTVDEKKLTWDVEWRSYSTMEGANPPDVNGITANPEKLVFRKLDMKKAYEKQKEHEQEHKQQVQ